MVAGNQTAVQYLNVVYPLYFNISVSTCIYIFMAFLKNIYKHFVSERHVKAAVEKQGKVFDPEIMKVIGINSVIFSVVSPLVSQLKSKDKSSKSKNGLLVILI